MLLCCSQQHVFAPVLRGEWLGFARIVFPSRNEEGDRCLMVKGFCRAVISLLAVILSCMTMAVRISRAPLIKGTVNSSRSQQGQRTTELLE